MDKSCKVNAKHVADICFDCAYERCNRGVLFMYVQVWDAESGQCLATLIGHDDEVLDVCFNYTGQLIATASADGETRATTISTPTTPSPHTSRSTLQQDDHKHYHH